MVETAVRRKPGVIELVVVEDDPDMRLLIGIMLTADPRIELMGEAVSAEEAMEVVGGLEPPLIVLDHSIAGELTGIQVAPLLTASAPHAKILLFTAYDLEREARAEPAIDSYLRKDDLDLLLPTVERLLELAPTTP